LKRLLDDAELDKSILREAASGNIEALSVGVSSLITSRRSSAFQSVGPVGVWARRVLRNGDD